MIPANTSRTKTAPPGVSAPDGASELMKSTKSPQLDYNTSFCWLASGNKTNVVKGGFEKNRLIQQSGGSFVVIDTAQGGERGGTLAGEAQTVYRRSFPCWYKQTPEAALSEGLGAAATNKHAPGIYRRIACRYILFA